MRRIVISIAVISLLALASCALGPSKPEEFEDDVWDVYMREDSSAYVRDVWIVVAYPWDTAMEIRVTVNGEKTIDVDLPAETEIHLPAYNVYKVDYGECRVEVSVAPMGYHETFDCVIGREIDEKHIMIVVSVHGGIIIEKQVLDRAPMFL